MMSTNKIFFLSAVLLGLSACAKDTFTTYTGNMPSRGQNRTPGAGNGQGTGARASGFSFFGRFA